MFKILLYVPFIICAVRCDFPACPADGTANLEKSCQCRTAFCAQYETCESEGNGGKGNCKAQHQTCDPAGNGGKGDCKQTIVAIPAGQRAPKCPNGTPNLDKNACECNFQNGVNCFQHQTCDPSGNGGKGDCKQTIVAGPAQPSGGSVGSSGSNGGLSGAGGNAGHGSLRCQTRDGSLLPTATLCEDTIDGSACQAVFSNDGPGVRPSKCDLPGLAEMARKCAKTCKLCCEQAAYGCSDDSSYGIDCTSQKAKCKDPQWTSVMTQACPGTCGLCNAGVCRDVIEGCASLKAQCRDFAFRVYMEKNCARTCQTCDQAEGASIRSGPAVDVVGVAAGTCVDTGVNCAYYVDHCDDVNNAVWRDIMRKSCAKTCGFCWGHRKQ